MPEIVIPIVNMNGASADGLVEQYSHAMLAISNAIYALRQTAPHGRDFQTAPDGKLFVKAQREHGTRIKTLQRIYIDLETLALGVQKQGDGELWADVMAELSRPDAMCTECRSIGPEGSECEDCGQERLYRPSSLVR